MNFYIADTHFGWSNKFEGRNTDTDETIIRNWNNRVTNADTVYILGDIGKEGNKGATEQLCRKLSVLKGKKILIKGNHDALKDKRIIQQFHEICDYKVITDNVRGVNRNVVLSHYPMAFWHGQHKNYIHIYGHIHLSEEEKLFRKYIDDINFYFNKETEEGRNDCPQCIAINAGCMLPYMGYAPRTLEEMLKGIKNTCEAK